MSEEPDYPNLAQAALDLGRFIESESLQGVFVGAFALGFVSEPRATRDIDAMVFWGERPPESLAALAEKHGFALRSQNSMEIARRSRVLLLVHSATGVTVDVSLGLLPFEREMARRATAFTRDGVTMRIATAEDLVVMKLLANREKDQFDVRQIVRANPSLDRRYVMRHIREMAEVLELPEMLESAIRLLGKPGRQG